LQGGKLVAAMKVHHSTAPRALGIDRSPGACTKGRFAGVESEPDEEHSHAKDQPSEEVADQNRWLNVVPTRSELTEYEYVLLI
jgi:hypothetical protein